MLKAYEITPEQAQKLNPNNFTFEMKYDGFRSFWTGHKILSDRGIDNTYKFPQIAKTLNSFSDTFLDAEIYVKGGCVHDINQKDNWKNAIMVVFDILRKDGKNITHKTLRDRRVALKEFFNEIKLPEKDTIEPTITFNSFKEGWDYITKNNLEGVMVKNLNSTYHHNLNDILKVYRVNSWKKCKNFKEGFEEIIGYNAGSIKGSFLLSNGGKISALSKDKVKEYYQLKEKGGKVFCEFMYLYKTNQNKYFQPILKRLVGGETHSQNTKYGGRKSSFF